MSDVRVVVEAPARLHLGVLDLGGSLGRRFGGIGAAIEAPSLVLEGVRAEGVSAEGPDAARVVAIARRVLAYHELTGGVALRVRRAIPAHAGLGSGTQLGLAVARLVAELYGGDPQPGALAEASERGRRSAIGTWTFAGGGFVLEGGRRPGGGLAPLLARHPVPPGWRYVLAIPDGAPGLSGDAESRAFASLPEPPVTEAREVAHLVLMQLLPALVDDDLEAFGQALERLQAITGGWWAAAQGGIFAPGGTAEAVAQLRRLGARGVGQSSWGPTAFGLVAGDEAARRVAAEMAGWLGGRGRVFHGRFSPTGARINRTSTGVRAD